MHVLECGFVGSCLEGAGAGRQTSGLHGALHGCVSLRQILVSAWPIVRSDAALVVENRGLRGVLDAIVLVRLG